MFLDKFLCKIMNFFLNFERRLYDFIVLEYVCCADIKQYKLASLVSSCFISGIILISASCNEAITKEFDAVIYPSIATDFTIAYNRNHEFADGNQITKIVTSILSPPHKKKMARLYQKIIKSTMDIQTYW